MRRTKNTTPFSLPVLLSFNELAWLAVFVAVAVTAYAILASRQDVAEEKKNTVAAEKIAAAAAEKIKELEAQLTRMRAGQSGWADSEMKAQKNLDDLSARLKEITAAHSAALSRIKQLTEDLEVVKRQLAEREKELAAFSKQASAPPHVDPVATLQARIRQLEAELADPNRQKGINQSLLGLQGRMERVAFLLDRSPTMGARWENTVELVNTWLQFLPVKQCVLIVFTNKLERYPRTGMFALDDTSEAVARRRTLINVVRNQPAPGGLFAGTDIHSALQMAYDCEGLDTIILFSDGVPSAEGGSSFILSGRRKELRPNLLRLAAEHPAIPINIVASGDYYRRILGADEDRDSPGSRWGTQAAFLLELAEGPHNPPAGVMQRAKGTLIGR